MTGKHPDGATRSSGHRGVQEFRGQMLNQKDRDAIIGFPCVKDGISQVWWRRHIVPVQPPENVYARGQSEWNIMQPLTVNNPTL